MQSTHKDWRGKGQFALVGTQRGTYTFVYLSNMQQRMEKKKGIVGLISKSVPFLFFMLFFLLVSFSPSRLFYICYSCLFPSPPPLLSFPSLCLITLVLSFRVGLLQSWCAAYFCVTSRTHHTHATRTLENTLINTVSTAAHMLWQGYTHTIYHSHAHTHISKLVSEHPEEVATVQNLFVTPSHLCFAHSVAQFNMAQHDMAHHGSAPHAICQLNTIMFR